MVETSRHYSVKTALHRHLIDINSATVPSEAYWFFAEKFKLTADQLSLKRRDGPGGAAAWENRVQRAKRKLVEDGVMDIGYHHVSCLRPDYQ